MREYIVRFNNITNRIKEEYIKVYSESKSSKYVTSFVRSTPIKIETFHDLVIEIAELAYLNPDYMLFFRGQGSLIKNKTNATLYPSIYRYESKIDIDNEFEVLDYASNKLVQIINKEKIKIGNIDEIKRIKKMQYAILQHYEVCKTPYLDVTHSIRIACSFASNSNTEKGNIYVLALPYLTGRISVDSEDDITNMRLISICTNSAKRPFFQDGYLVGTEFTDKNYTKKSILDLNNRLVAIYEFDNDLSFWGSNETCVKNHVLYPENDPMIEVCNKVKAELENRVIVNASNRDIGEFLVKWIIFEEQILALSPEKNIGYSLKNLLNNEIIDYNKYEILNSIRVFRNNIVHKSSIAKSNQVNDYLRILKNEIENFESLINSSKINLNK